MSPTTGLNDKGVDLCAWQSKTAPELLEGNQGSPSSKDYWFTHLADVDKDNKKHHFVYSIKNNHSIYYLPAKWLRGDGGVQLAFSRIVPNGCGSNDFETSLKFKEDFKSTIKYGPHAQINKDAPLYVYTAANNLSQVFEGRELKSRICADLLDENESNHRLDLVFTTSLEGKDLIYTVTNFGDRNEMFTIPVLTSSIDAKLAVIGDVIARWRGEGTVFFVRADREPQRHIIKLNSHINIREELVQIEVLSEGGRSLVSGQVSLYIPMLKK